MNIYDVSKKAGVSIATVSRVVNGSSRVSEKTRQNVLRVMEELNYTPNVFARGLGLNSMNTIGIMCSNSSDPYLAEAVYHLERTLRQNGYDCILCCTGYDHGTKESYMDLLLSKRVDAVILVGSNFVEEEPEQQEYIRQAAARIPVFFVNGCLEGRQIYCVCCDDRKGMKEVVSSQLLSGRTAPLFLFNAYSYSGMQKIAGYQDALREAGLPVREELMHCLDRNKDVHFIRDDLLELWNSGLRFDCIIASEDTLAIGALKFALAQGLSVPADLSVTGYNNSSLALFCEPELTSFDSRVRELCEQSVRTLLQVLRGEPAEQIIRVEGELIRRGTTT